MTIAYAMAKRLFLAGFFCCCAFSIDAVTWGASISGIYTDATIDFSANPTLAAAVVVTTTINSTITMTVNTSDRTITSSDFQMHFVTVSAVDTIQINVENNLTFASGTTSTTPFIVTFSGPGQMILNYSDGKKVTFDGNDTNKFGTQFFIGMRDSNTSKVLVQRDSSADDSATLELNRNSMLGFMAPTSVAAGSTEDGLIEFNPSSTNANGEMKIVIQDNCAYTVTGVLQTGTPPSDVTIGYTTPAGRIARMYVQETDTSALINSVRVVNYNATLPFLLRNQFNDTVTSYTGYRPGFILGNNARLELDSNTYFDYIGASINVNPEPYMNGLSPGSKTVRASIKQRNPSAMFVDGFNPTSIPAAGLPANVLMHDTSGLYFRSGVDKEGIVVADYVVAVTGRTSGIGELVLDVEAAMTIDTTGTGDKVINILSRKVNPSGGLIEIGSTAEAVFPEIILPSTQSYNTASFLINNPVDIYGAILRHDDFNRTIYDMNSPPDSAATYVGGEAFKIFADDDLPRPSFRFFNSRINLHTSAAITGMDLFFPNLVDGNTTSTVAWYQNGYQIDNGTGRTLVCGTDVGAQAIDLFNFIDRNCYFDILQDQAETSAGTQRVNAIVAPNDDTIIEGITGNISTQYSVQTLFLGYKSNLQVGKTPEITSASHTNPFMFIDGDFFSFGSAGGLVGLISLSGTTGSGGIFVDQNGIFRMSPSFRANMGVMVTKSSDGVVDLPKEKVFFNSKVGLTQWQLDLSQTVTVVSSTDNFSDFTIDWKAVTKDFAGGFIPFDPATNVCVTVTTANLKNIPVVAGEVDQFQFKRSRLGDQAHLLVDGGLIRQLVMLSGYDSSEAPTGFIAIKNDGRIGLGDNATNLDALDGRILLGINGITLSPDGNGTVDVLSDIVINNACHIAAGPNFGSSGQQIFTLRSENPQTIRVKTGGKLILTSMTSSNQVLRIDGQLQIIFEPNTQLIMGGGTLQFTDRSSLRLQPYAGPAPSGTSDPTLTNALRTKFIGTGTILFDEDSTLFVTQGSILGVETNNDIDTTDLNITFEDKAQLSIGTDTLFGGAFQIGNAFNATGTSVSTAFTFNGSGALLDINSQGFLGLGVGIVRKPLGAPNNWSVGALFNVNNISLTFTEGTWIHDEIVPSSSENAGLLAIGPLSGVYSLTLDPVDSRVLGGGNMIQINAGVTSVAPVVEDSTSSATDIAARSILASKPLLDDANNGVPGSTQSSLFNYLKTNPITTMASPKVNIAVSSLGRSALGFVFGTTIDRNQQKQILKGAGQFAASPGPSYEVGAVNATVNRTTGELISVTEIQSIRNT
ncbi:hypothetical protein A3F06_00035 [candidate division TM6 bacterium RIFCSPHIGHO2_12_FULL_36_22]|nr:MAG: hypothetical protein A3F06_00035 [candidate division TM6 bacterium RIFCSPHIGHO2_12_FULL_36_22]